MDVVIFGSRGHACIQMELREREKEKKREKKSSDEEAYDGEESTRMPFQAIPFVAGTGT